MSIEKMFPFVLIVLNVCAAIVYMCKGDLKHGVYWIAAAVLTLTVTI